ASGRSSMVRREVAMVWLMPSTPTKKTTLSTAGDAFYRDLAARRPSMQVFLNGWRNRVKALGQYLAELEREEN
ncbi:hypothetical protein V6C16_13145, partial [Desulfovibrio sp. 1188_IL3213]